MKLTFKKLLFATIVVLLLNITSIWIQNNYGLAGWISPNTVKNWAFDIGLVLLWIFYFIEKKKEKN